MSETPPVEVVAEETAITARSGRPPIPVPRDLAEQLEFARVVLKSGLSLGHRSAESIVLALQLGSELGFTPMQALRCITVINGKPAPNADACVAAAIASGRCIYFREVETTEKSSTWETLRKGDPKPTRYTFTMQDAEQAGLTSRGSDTWKKYPKRMLAARAKKYLAQDKYPDILGGLLSEEELHDLAAQAPSRPPIAMPRRIGEVKRVEQVGAVDVAPTDTTPVAPTTSRDRGDDARSFADHDLAAEMRERGIDSVPQVVASVVASVGAAPSPRKPGCVSQAQISLLMAACHRYDVKEQALIDHLGTLGIESRKDIPVAMFDELITWAANQGGGTHARIVSSRRPAKP